jgi:hypothetical protein
MQGEKLRRRFRVFFAICAAIPCLSIDMAPAAAEQPMTFRLVRVNASGCAQSCGYAIQAQGRITADTPAALAAAIQQQKASGSQPTVVLDSPGGSVLYAMKLGELLRDTGSTAIVETRCYSACVYAFLGAQRRVVAPGARLGVHRMFVSAEGSDQAMKDQQRRQWTDDSAMRRVLTGYTADMGVNTAVITAAEQTPSTRLRILSVREIQAWRLASLRR